MTTEEKCNEEPKLWQRTLSTTKLIPLTRYVTEVCADYQHGACDNGQCECRCHE